MLSLDNRLRIRQRGVALILTLVLLSLLVIVMLALVGLTRVESSSADNVKDAALARQNALQAMNMAIGQLQRYAGRDKATTFRGDLFGHSDERKNLTAVWNDDSGWAERVWLVSGSENSTSFDDSRSSVVVPTATPAAGQVTLVGSNSVTAVADYIIVERQDIVAPSGTVPGLSGAQTIGHYAYWVGDEGSKASLNFADPTRLNPSRPDYDAWVDVQARERLNQQMLPQPQITNLHSDFNGLDITDDVELNNLLKILSNESLSFVGGSNATIRSLFHDVTPRAEAVLADLTTNDGRLKLDLSDTTKRSSDLQNYLGASLYAAGTTNYTTAHEISVAAFPVITEASVLLSFYRSGGELRIAYKLDVETWNPYASKLRYDSTSANKLRVEVEGLPGQVDLTTDGTPATSVSGLSLNTQLYGGSVLLADVNGVIEWEPGQFRTLSTNGSAALVDSSGASSAPNVASWSQALADAVNTMEITVSYPQVSNLEFRLVLDAATDIELSTYEIASTFGAAATNTTSTTSSTATNSALGYGVQLVNDVEYFAVTEDPRRSMLTAAGAFINATDAAATWTNDPAANANKSFSSGDAFHYDAAPPGKQIVLFDLPRQEVISAGQLRHLINNGATYRGANAYYDTSFFSTAPTAASWSSADIQTKPLPNRYLRLINPIKVVAANDANLRNGDQSARYMLQTAAFNVNSTSAAAWRAVLGGAKLTDWTHDTDGLSSTSATAGVPNLDHAYFRFGHGGQFLTNAPLVTGSIGDADDVLFTAGRELTGPEVEKLAAQVVDRIRVYCTANNRPFRSLAEFISSNVISDAINGLNISAAIPVVNRQNLNNGLPADRAGTPGALTQEDVIAAIAPIITPRSDTFKIRSYGDVYNPATGDVMARAWCEAIVQRVPDVAEDLDAAIADVVDPDFGANPFGRKFIVVSFRWLTSDDI